MLPKQILIFEDVVFRNDLSRSLKERKDIVLRTARSGWEIVVSTSFVKPDLVVMYHWLPDMLGDEVIDQIRRQQALKEVPILLLAPAIGPAALERLRKLGPVLLYKEDPDRTVLINKIVHLLGLPLRRELRIPIKIPVRVKDGPKESFGITRYLSSIGSSIETDMDTQPDNQIVIDFLANEQDSSVVGWTKAVARSVHDFNGQKIIGVEFIESSPKFERFLAKRIQKGNKLVQTIGQIERLPTLPSITSIVLEEMLKGGDNPKRMLSLIRSEPTLTAYLLKIANATAYRLDKPVMTVGRAMAQLDTKTVRNAMLGFSLFRDLELGGRYSLIRNLWRHALSCGLYCELLARRFGVDSEEAYTLGLLHDIGKTVLISEYFKEHEQWIDEEFETSWSNIRENDLFGMSHAEVGGAILSKWQIPECIQMVIEQHHCDRVPDDLSEPQTRFWELLRCANELAHSGNGNVELPLTKHEIKLLGQKVAYSLRKTEDAFGQREEIILCIETVEEANKELSQELHAAEERNALLTRAYERTRQNLISLVQGEKYHALGRILQGVSHEMNNPLGFVLSNLNTLKEYVDSINAFIRDEENAPSRIEVDEILQDLPLLTSDTHEGVLRVSSVVQALRHFNLEGNSRITTTNLRKCLEEAIALVKSSKPEGVAIELGSGSLQDSCVDHGGMVRVFMEIILNAFAAMPTVGKMEIDFHQEPDQALVSIRDNGEGISEENVKHVFEPFFTTHSVGDGMGLGLSVAYGIVSKHQGQLLISSNAGQGTLVEVRIPNNKIT